MSLGYQANAENGGHSILNSAYLRVLIACRFSMSFILRGRPVKVREIWNLSADGPNSRAGRLSSNSLNIPNPQLLGLLCQQVGEHCLSGVDDLDI
jgi:hypothetical protein